MLGWATIRSINKSLWHTTSTTSDIKTYDMFRPLELVMVGIFKIALYIAVVKGLWRSDRRCGEVGAQ